jgi:hypothetical protein
MQTFLPNPDFKKSLEILDNKRLGKQRVESFQILNCLQGKSKGWRNHPATRMWTGFENALIEYLNLSIGIWKDKGFKNTMEYQEFFTDKTFDDPPWLGNEEFHASHRSNLLRKDPEFYGKYGWTESSDLPYIWPV